MKPVSLLTALAFTAFGSTLAQNSTADASTDVDNHRGNEDHHHGGNNGNHKGGEHGHNNRHGHHKGHRNSGTHAGSTLDRCTMFQHFNEIIDTAANATALSSKFHNNSTRMARFQEEARQLQNASSPQGAILANFRSNATFLGVCDAIFATESNDHSCQRLLLLESQAAIVANATTLNNVTHGNNTKALQLQNAVAKAQPELDALHSNSSLLQFCAMFETRAQCFVIKTLEADVKLARNATKLNQTFEGNTTRITAFQYQVTESSAKLDKLLNNATLVSICKTEMPFILDLANELPNDTVTSADAVTQSGASRSPAGSMTSLVTFFFLAFYLL
ncbi:hypothetical protein SBRCBS47491_003915 [Sporothrix bragantina]|uniref:Uncharacterized protein n=1 Tax=Sporothrix bragantina TaxID=671064 RepID=A0ABP0BKC6_9PEZI